MKATKYCDPRTAPSIPQGKLHTLTSNRSHIILKKAKEDPIFHKKLSDLGKVYENMVCSDSEGFSKVAPSIMQFALDSGFLAGVSSQADIDELITWLNENICELAYYAQERQRIQPGARYTDPVGKVYLSWTVKSPREREAMIGIRLALDFFNIDYFDYTSERIDDSKDNTFKIEKIIKQQVNASFVSVEIRSAGMEGRWISFERNEIEKNSAIQRIMICLDFTYAYFMKMPKDQEDRTLRIDMSGGHTFFGRTDLFEQTLASSTDTSYYDSGEYLRKCFQLGLHIRMILENLTIKSKASWITEMSRRIFRSKDEYFFLQQVFHTKMTTSSPAMNILDMALNAKLLLRNKSYQEAIEVLDKAITISLTTQNSEATSNLYDDLSLCYSHLGQHDRAIELVDQAISLVPDSRRLFTNKGLRLLRARRFEEAEACAYKAMKLAPDDPSGKKLLDKVLAEKRGHNGLGCNS